MPYSAAMAISEGYTMRVDKADASQRFIAWSIITSFRDPKDPKYPKQPKDLWPLVIDNQKKEVVKDNSPVLTPEEILKLKFRLCRT